MKKRTTKQELLQEVRRLHQQITHLDTRNRELAELSNTDGLTSLYNHRFMMERCLHEFERARRYSESLTCAIIDIDHFKEINDSHGHQFGDFVLRELGALLKEKTRASDVSGRYGGEEFIILAKQSLAETTEYVFRLHSLIAAHAFTNGEKTAKITVSVGISVFDDSVNSWHDLIGRADQALYLAKNSGRNIVRIWSGTQTETEHIENDEIDLLRKQFAALYSKAKKSYVKSTNAILKAIDAKDRYSLTHSVNVAAYSVMLARAAGQGEQAVETVKNAALLHDVGKIGISEKILTKKTPLTMSEYEKLKKHPQIGAAMIREISLLAKEAPLILHHHERFDGTGYPHALRANEIPLGAKILAIADAFDAMTTNREFRARLSRPEAIQVLVAEKGRQFDPGLVDLFVSCLEQSGRKEASARKTAESLPGSSFLQRKWPTSGRTAQKRKTGLDMLPQQVGEDRLKEERQC